MKRTERHHLKENELGKIARQTRQAVEARPRETTAVLIALLAIAIAAAGYWGWQQRVQGRASALLAAAMTVQEATVGPPSAPGTPAIGLNFPTVDERAEAALAKFKTAADAYPSTDAGIFARYQQGATLMTLGKPAEAAKVYQQVLDHAGNGIYAQTAHLGLAEAQARAGQYDQAINGFKELAQRKDGALPVDGILMQLGRVYRDAGKPADAQQTFNRLVQEYPDSPFNADAKRELDSLKKT
jgi:TolA-binding protein